MIASSAWPTVWPKLRTRRGPASRSSSSTTRALMRQHSAIRSDISAASCVEDRGQVRARCARRASAIAITPYFTTSYSPARNSRRGSVRSTSGSHTTIDGAWNEPTRFLPSGRLTPTLPPMALSTCDEQRRRHLHEPDAAQIGRRRKSGDVADDPAAKRDERGGSIEPAADQRVVDLLDRGERLRALAVRNEHRLGPSDDRAQPGAVTPPDRRAADDDRRAGARSGRPGVRRARRRARARSAPGTARECHRRRSGWEACGARITGLSG